MTETISPERNSGSLSLRFNGQPVSVEGDVSWDMAQIEDMAETVTSMELCIGNEDASDSPRVIYKEANEISVSYDEAENGIKIEGPKNMFGKGTALVYLAEYLAASKLAANNGEFLTHAAAIFNPETNRSQVLLGEKGAGKTTLAIRLCSEAGFELIGNDQVYIGSTEDEIYTTGGNAWFNVRRTATASDDYMQRFAKKIDDHTGLRPSWNDKVRLNPEDIGVKRKLGSVVVGNIFHIRLDPKQDSLYASPWRGVQQNLVLHERFGRHISGQATPLQDDKGSYLGSLPLIDYSRSVSQRDLLVKRIISKGVLEVFAPSSEAAYEYIVRQRG